MDTVTIKNGDEIPPSFGRLRTARKKSLVEIREPDGPEETFKKQWGTLKAEPGQDVVVMSESDPKGYPVKRDVFDRTYQETTRGSGQFRKTAVSRLVQVPKGVTAKVETMEGTLTAEHPDYIVVGKDNEVYVNAHEWVEQNLEFIDSP